MTRRILLLGATGYTGSRTAAVMAAAGLRPVLVGRDASRLRVLSARTGGLETAVVDVGDAAQLASMIGARDVVVNTVGPFGRWGAPVVRAVIDAGGVYLDSTGESPFIRDVFERFGERAELSGAALLPAFGHDWVPGNLAGALALRAAESAPRPVSTVQVGYFLTGDGKPAASRGTVRSVADMALAPGYRFVDGGIREEIAGVRRRDFDVDGRALTAVSVGGTEQFGLPRLAPGLTRVDVFLGWLGAASAAASTAAPLLGAAARVPLLARLASRAASVVAERTPAEPDPSRLVGVRSVIIAEAFDEWGTRLAHVRLDGTEPYAMTAALLTHGAARAAADGVRGSGALGPVEAFGVDELRRIAEASSLVVAER